MKFVDNLIILPKFCDWTRHALLFLLIYQKDVIKIIQMNKHTCMWNKRWCIKNVLPARIVRSCLFNATYRTTSYHVIEISIKTYAHINITMKSINKMCILLNSIMCQWISLSDCKNEKSSSINGAQSPKKLDMHDLSG